MLNKWKNFHVSFKIAILMLVLKHVHWFIDYFFGWAGKYRYCRHLDQRLLGPSSRRPMCVPSVQYWRLDRERHTRRAKGALSGPWISTVGSGTNGPRGLDAGGRTLGKVSLVEEDPTLHCLAAYRALGHPISAHLTSPVAAEEDHIF